MRVHLRPPRSERGDPRCSGGVGRRRPHRRQLLLRPPGLRLRRSGSGRAAWPRSASTSLEKPKADVVVTEVRQLFGFFEGLPGAF
ncbi:MAG: hypothetical protein MZV49_00160 [Rhodopseudomonas palustris]|nr:hypothetical protein [Rhodopseudomonas palustris]